jgi:hypothetical protein
MINKLKKVIELEGVNYVTFKLGYRSANTIYAWLKNNKIPNTAKVRVQEFLTFYFEEYEL